jgi:hypothetical protein
MDGFSSPSKADTNCFNICIDQTTSGYRVSGVFALSVIMELLVIAEENEVVKIMEKIASTFSPAGRVPYLYDCLYHGVTAVKFFPDINRGLSKWGPTQ